MGRHSMDEEPPPPSGRRLATGRHPAVDAPVRGTGEPAQRRPDGRMSTGHHLAVEAKAVMPTPPRPPDRRIATGGYPAVTPGGLSPQRRDGRRSTGQHPTVDGHPHPAGGPTPGRLDGRTATGRRPAVDTPTNHTQNPTPRRPDARTATGRRPAVDAPPRKVDSPAPQRSDGRTATGYHRAVGAAATRRRIAKWPIVAGVLVLLVALGLGGWAWANRVLDNRDAAHAKDCTDGASTMKVIVAPGVAHPVQAAAAKWNQARTVVRAHCVTIDVQSRPSDQVLGALTGRAGPETIGGIPAAWVPEVAGNWATQLATTRPDLIGSPPENLTNDFSYVGLGGSAVDEVTIRAAQVFRDFLLAPAQRPDFTDAGLAS